MSQPQLQPADRLDVVVVGGRVLDPGRGVDTVMDVGIADGRIARLESMMGRGVARRVVDALTSVKLALTLDNGRVVAIDQGK